MKTFEIHLTDEEFETLNNQFPNTKASSTVGRRAESLIKLHYLKVDSNAEFSNPRDGADLLVKTKGEEIKIEIKGTAQNNLNRNNIKVTGQRSYQALINGLPLYRVAGVFEKRPKVYVLLHGIDYTLEQEQRWVARPRSKA